jgi:electron transfer flavoprotein alpha subunit
MAGLLVVGEVAPDGTLSKLSTEVATLARGLQEASALPVEGIVHGAAADPAATELSRFVPTVHLDRAVPADRTVASLAPALAAFITTGYDYVLLPASPDGRDLAGMLSALTGWGVLANATAVRWAEAGPVVEMSVFGGKLITESAFVGGHGFITVRPNAVVAEPSSAAGTTHEISSEPAEALPPVRIVDRVAEASAAAPIEEARVIVAGGRGVGGPDGFRIVGELAEVLGGAVGATRAAVDSGWIPYAQQIGQTGKIVKPALYVALGISGAIQHKVGMQTAGTILAVNRDPDAPIAEFADLVVVGDLAEVVPAIVAAVRARTA